MSRTLGWWVRSYVRDLGAALSLRDRDSRGRFVKGNRYRFSAQRVWVGGKGKWFLAQEAMVGSFFRAIGGL